jgi:hypothetical protein
MIGSRNACTAGGSPPIIPMRSEKTMPLAMMAGLTRNENARQEKLSQFSIPAVNPLKGRTARQPSAPPRRQ